MKLLTPTEIGRPVQRTESADKVTGRARYAYEYDVVGAAYAWIVPSSIARGRIVSFDDSAARAAGGVLDVLWHGNAERLADAGDGELQVLQDGGVHYRGQPVAVVIAETLEGAREAAALVRVEYEQHEHDVVLRPDHPRLYAPETLNAGFDTDSDTGDVDSPDLDGAGGAVVVDVEYTTPSLHNNPMEPHASIARWADGRLDVWDSNQAPYGIASTLATAFSLETEQVRVITEHVGGGFGSKGTARPNVVLAAMAARAAGRPVKLAVTRQGMFSLVGYRTPTQQHLRLVADAEGRLQALTHEVVEQTSTIQEFAEQTGESTRHMYATPNLRVRHRVAALDVPTPRWMRAPGECPGMFALESAMDELALAVDLDPIELRVRNEPDVDPETGTPFSSRHYVECLREGAERFGWAQRPRARRDGRWLIGTGVAGATYPAQTMASTARVAVDERGHFDVYLAAADIGQGSRTVLAQIAADALSVGLDRVTVHLGDSSLPQAPVAGGSSGTSSWGWAVTDACRALTAKLGRTDGNLYGGMSAEADIGSLLENREARPRQAFGAHFVQVRVDVDSGEVRLDRGLGVFAVGRVMNPRLARSQFLGGMCMGYSMALMEEGVLDATFGDFANHDLAEYHVVVNRDIPDLDAVWIDEHDDDLNPMGGKGIGEIGIVGSAAAVVNAVADATGVRVRDLPVKVESLLPHLPPV